MKLIGFLEGPDGLMAIVSSSDVWSSILGDLGCYDLAKHQDKSDNGEGIDALNGAFRSVFGEDMEIPTNPIVPPLEQLWLMSDVLGWPRGEASQRLREATEMLPVEPWNGEQGHNFIAARERLLRKARREGST